MMPEIFFNYIPLKAQDGWLQAILHLLMLQYFNSFRKFRIVVE